MENVPSFRCWCDLPAVRISYVYQRAMIANGMTAANWTRRLRPSHQAMSAAMGTRTTPGSFEKIARRKHRKEAAYSPQPPEGFSIHLVQQIRNREANKNRSSSCRAAYHMTASWWPR